MIDDARRTVEKALAATMERIFLQKKLRVNPRKLSVERLDELELTAKDLRLDVLKSGQVSVAAYLGMLAEAMRPYLATTDAMRVVEAEKIFEGGQDALGELMTGSRADGKTVMTYLQKMVKEAGAEAVEGGGPEFLGDTIKRLSDITQALRIMVYASAQELAEKLKSYDLDRNINTDQIKRTKSKEPGATDKIYYTDDQLLDMAAAMDAHALLLETFLGGRAEFGRGLYAFRGKLPKTSPGKRQQMLRQMIGQAGGHDAIVRQARKVLSAIEMGGVGAGGAAVLPGRWGASGGMLLEYWMNAILSGPKTFTVNLGSNAVMAVWRPLELLVGSALRGDKDTMEEAMLQISSLGTNISEAFKFAKKAWSDERNYLDAENRLLEHAEPRAAITGRNLRTVLGAQDSQSEALHAVTEGFSWVGKNVVRAPGRALAATDEFFKQIGYRSVARAGLFREAKLAGIPAKQRQAWVEDQLTRMVREGQAFSKQHLIREGYEKGAELGLEEDDLVVFVSKYVDEQLEKSAHLGRVHEKALKAARNRTYTDDLWEGSISNDVNRFVQRHPVSRAFLPFVRTPVNLLRFGAARSPIGGAAVLGALAMRKFNPSAFPNLSQSRFELMRKLASNDPNDASDVVGQITFALTTTAAAVFAVQQGRVTGKGPADKEQRELMMSYGWQPYSIFLGEDPLNPQPGERYVSFMRLEQISLPFALIADAAEYTRYADDVTMENEQYADAIYGIAIAIANNFTNRSYVQGISNFVEALSSTEAKVPAMMRRYAGSMVPNLLAQTVPTGLDPFAGADPAMREVRTMVDALRGRVPGLSDRLPMQRNVLGDPVRRLRSLGSDVADVLGIFSPITYTTVEDDRILKEFNELGHGFSPPKPVQNGYDLRDYEANGMNAYERWLVLHGEVRIGGKSLREALRARIDSSAYQRIPQYVPPELGENPRIRDLRTIISTYRRAAFEALMREAPELEALDRENRNQRRALRRGTLERLLSA